MGSGKWSVPSFVLCVAALGACLAPAGAALAAAGPTPAQPHAIINRITSANPDTCSSSDSKREVIVLQGDFPALDKHGAAMIVTQPGKPAVALPYDPKALTVPSFSYAPHSVTVLYDGTQWCHVTGALTFQLALGGRLSNVFSMHIDGDDS